MGRYGSPILQHFDGFSCFFRQFHAGPNTLAMLTMLTMFLSQLSQHRLPLGFMERHIYEWNIANIANWRCSSTGPGRSQCWMGNILPSGTAPGGPVAV
jgi:hypothetical protein